MAVRTAGHRLLPANVKAIAKAVRASVGSSAGAQEYRIEGERGLVLHVLPSGTATWYFHFDVELGKARKRRKLKIGRLDDVSLADVQDRVLALRQQVRQGADPAAAKAAIKTAMTFGDLVALRFEAGDPLTPGTAYDYQLLLKRDILPAIGAFPVRSITRRHVIAVIDGIAARGSMRRADTARIIISSIFAFGMDRGHVDSNPAAGMRNRHSYMPRDVVASGDDIRRLWTAMDNGEAVMTTAMTAIIRLALLTGQRRTEIAAVTKDELELSSVAPLLTLPRGRAKNRNMHRVPLSPQAAGLFAEAVDSSGSGRYVFPGELEGRPIASRSVSKAMERTRAKLGITDITVHDLRRTAGSFMAQFGVPEDIRARVLNHGGKRSGSVTNDVYGWYTYDAEKRAALELWADALMCMVRGETGEIENYTSRLARLKGRATVRVG